MEKVGNLRILIADHHRLMSDAIARALLLDEEIIVDAAPSLQDAFDAMAAISYDIVLVEYNMPGISSVEYLRAFMEKAGTSRVALFSENVEREVVASAIKMGLHGFISKTAGMKSLVSIIRFIAEGQIYVPLSYVEPVNRILDESDQIDREFSSSDLGMLRAIEIGKTNREIGHQFGVSESRVKMILRRIFVRLNAKNRVQVVQISRKMGLI